MSHHRQSLYKVFITIVAVLKTRSYQLATSDFKADSQHSILSLYSFSFSEKFVGRLWRLGAYTRKRVPRESKHQSYVSLEVVFRSIIILISIN